MIAAFILNGWSTLKNRCLFFTLFVSEIMHVKLGVFCGSRPNDVGEAAMEGQTTHLIRGKSTSVRSSVQQGESLNGQSGSPFDEQSLIDTSQSPEERTSEGRHN